MDLSSSSRTSLNRRYIHMILGINYLTLFVADMDQALECLKKAGAELHGETPVSLGGKTQLSVVRDPDGNFVERIGTTKD